MKRICALILLLATLLCAVACGEPTTPTTSEQSSGAASSGSSSEAASSETSGQADGKQAIIPFGVYYLKSNDGRYLTASSTNTKVLMSDGSKEESCRWTLYYRTVTGGEKHFVIYRGIDMSAPLTAKGSSAGSAISRGSTSVVGKSHSFELVPSADGKTYQIASATHPELCLGWDKDGNAAYVDATAKTAETYWTIEKAAPSEDYDEYISETGNIVMRIPHYFVTRRSVGLTKDLAQKYVDLLQIAYEAEIELTGYVPYDVIVIKAFEKENIVAGVVNDYNVITVDVGFMQGEMEKYAFRYKTLKRWDLGFAIMHEMGHMFDSKQAWNFESEAWTDFKLCYATMICNERWNQPDGYPVALAPSDFGKKDVFTYEELDEMYTRCGHYKEGAMKTNYSFYAMAHIYLKVALQYGWDPFIKTFHYFSEGGETQDTYKTQLDRYMAYANKLSEFIGKEPKALVDEVNPTAWKVIIDFYTNGGKAL